MIERACWEQLLAMAESTSHAAAAAAAAPSPAYASCVLFACACCSAEGGVGACKQVLHCRPLSRPLHCICQLRHVCVRPLRHRLFGTACQQSFKQALSFYASPISQAARQITATWSNPDQVEPLPLSSNTKV